MVPRNKLDPKRYDGVVINPSLLRSDDFESFFAEREVALLDRIESAMGKPLARDMVMPEGVQEMSEEAEEVEEAVA